MKEENNYIEFELLGEVFKVKTDVSKDYFLSLVDYLKQKLTQTKMSFPNQSNIRVLIFSALDIVDELFKEKKHTINESVMEKLTRLSESLASVIEDVDNR